jgi:hypothetical protein
VSFIGPYYAICRWTDPQWEHVAQTVEHEIVATYQGHEPIPPELGNAIVPDATPDGHFLGTVTIYQCFFSELWLNSLRLRDHELPEYPSVDDDS